VIARNNPGVSLFPVPLSVQDQGAPRAEVSHVGPHRPTTPESGLTLVELIIVVAIVSILATAAIPIARFQVKRVKERELRRDLWEMRDAIDHYKDAADKGAFMTKMDSMNYPPDLETLVNGVEVQDKKVKFLLQLALTKSENPALRDVPLILDVARSEEQRRVFEVLMGMKATGRPYFVAPAVPKDRADALRAAFMATMHDPDFLADADKALGEIDPLSGPGMQKLIANVYTLPPAILAKARETVKAPGAD